MVEGRMWIVAGMAFLWQHGDAELAAFLPFGSCRKKFMSKWTLPWPIYNQARTDANKENPTV